MPERSDADLLADTSRGDSFGLFYRRHERLVLGYLMRATGSSELALDLAAETFARALESRAGYDSGKGEARAWLLGIARHVLVGSLTKGRVELEARTRLGMSSLTIDERLAHAIEATAEVIAEESVREWLSALTPQQRAAVRGRVIEERTSAELAGELECSQAVVRQRVHRGLAVIRESVEGSG